MSVFCLKSFIFNTEHICESTIFQKQKNLENNLTKRVLIFLTDSAIPLIAFQISCTVTKKKRKLLCKTATALWIIKHNMTYKWLLKCTHGCANAHLSHKGRNTFSINMEVPPGAGGRSGLFLLAPRPPSRATTAGLQKINRWWLAWDSIPGSSYWGLMHQTRPHHSPELKPTGLELPKSIVLN